MHNQTPASTVLAERTADTERAALLCLHTTPSAPAPHNSRRHSRDTIHQFNTRNIDEKSSRRDIAELVGHVANFVGEALRHLPDSGYHSNHAGRR